MVSFLEGVILSLVQGITEWFPISSSGHLAIAQNLLGVQDMGFVVYLHFASVLAVVIWFWKDIINLFSKKQTKYILKLLIAIIPAAIIGYLLRAHVSASFSNLFFIGVFFIIFGLYAYFTKLARARISKPSYVDSFLIGISQIFSLFPGISRSGMTVTTGLISGIKKEQAIKFSFLLAIPMVFGASLVEAKRIAQLDAHFTTLLTSFTLTLFISLITINLLIKIVKNNKFHYFGVYNVILGIIVIIWSLVG
jgi:undecaprenyl-diphosphatase